MIATRLMVSRLRTYFAFAAVGCAPWTLPHVKAGDDPSTPWQTGLKVTLVWQHKDASLAAISRKTPTMIVWDTDRPVWTVRIPNGPKRDESGGRSRLALLEIPSGKQFTSTNVGFFPRSVNYFPQEDRVIYKHDVTLGDFQVRIWNFAEGTNTTCLDGEAAVGITGITPISEHEILAVKKENRSHTFLRLRSSDCSPLDNSADSEQSMFSGVFSTEQPAMSPDRRTLGYFVRLPKTGPNVLMLRNLTEGHNIHRIEAPQDWLFWGLRFSPDSRLALVDTYRRDRFPLDADAQHHVLVYDVASGRLMRTTEIDARSGLALSPDGQLLAAGTTSVENPKFGRERVKAVGVLYDFESGRELARAEHPWFKTSPGMRGTLTGLEFSADGEYLITSTNDIRAWRIEHQKARPGK